MIVILAAPVSAQSDPDIATQPPPPPPVASTPSGTGTATSPSELNQTTVSVFPVGQHAANRISAVAIAVKFVVRDAGTNRLFVGGRSGGRGMGLLAVNLDHGDVKPVKIGDATALAVDADDNKIFVAEADHPQIEVLDRKSLQSIDRILLNDSVGTLDYDARDHVLVAGAARQALAWIIDARQHVVVESVVLSGVAASSVFDKSRHRELLSIPAADSIDVIDPMSKSVSALWQLPPGFGPRSLALTYGDAVAAVAGSRGSLASFDAGSGQILGTAIVGWDVQALVADASPPGRVVAFSGAAGSSSVYAMPAGSAPVSVGSFASPSGSGAAASVPARIGGSDLYMAASGSSGTYLQRFTLPGPR